MKIISQSSAGTRERTVGVLVVVSAIVTTHRSFSNLLEYKAQEGQDLHLGDLVAGQKMPRSWLGPSSVGCLSLLFSQSEGLSGCLVLFFFPFVFPNPDEILNWTSLGRQQTRDSSGTKNMKPGV